MMIPILPNSHHASIHITKNAFSKCKGFFRCQGGHIIVCKQISSLPPLYAQEHIQRIRVLCSMCGGMHWAVRTRGELGTIPTSFAVYDVKKHLYHLLSGLIVNAISLSTDLF